MYDYKREATAKILLLVPAYWKPILKQVAEAESRTVSGLMRDAIRERIKDQLATLGRNVDPQAGAIMAVQPSAREGAEMVDMRVGPSDDPDENVVRNFMAIPGED